MEFNVDVEIKNIIDDIRHYFALNGNENTKAVIGISGGKDSTIAAALLVKALGKDRVFGVMMPDGNQKDLDDAVEVCKILDIPHCIINIKFTTASFIEDITRNTALQPNSQVYTNMPARVRMTTLYNVAAMIGGRVINTGNKSEAYVGYTTKYGDLAGDYAVLRDYYVTEVYAIGDALTWDDGSEMLPATLVHKAPADGMSGKTDADNMGFTYEQLDDYLIKGVTPPANVLKDILDRHMRNKHKEHIMIPHPYCRTRPYKARNSYQDYVDGEGPFSF